MPPSLLPYRLNGQQCMHEGGPLQCHHHCCPSTGWSAMPSLVWAVCRFISLLPSPLPKSTTLPATTRPVQQPGGTTPTMMYGAWQASNVGVRAAEMLSSYIVASPRGQHMRARGRVMQCCCTGCSPPPPSPLPLSNVGLLKVRAQPYPWCLTIWCATGVRPSRAWIHVMYTV